MIRQASLDKSRITEALASFRDCSNRPHALVGFDGYIDTLVRPRRSQMPNDYYRTVREFVDALLALGGTSSDIAVHRIGEKIGGNGPLLAQSLAAKGVPCSCIGAMGRDTLADLYRPLADRIALYSLSEPARTYALEFDDGKLMFGDTDCFWQIGWSELLSRLGRDTLVSLFQESSLFCFANWSGLPRSADLLEGIIHDICPVLKHTACRFAFFDLADPTGKSHEQFQELFSALECLRGTYQRIIGLNPKECLAVYNHFFDKNERDFTPWMGQELLNCFPAEELVIHVAGSAYTGVAGGELLAVPCRRLERPVLSVGAGDNFNAGFCLGKLCGLDSPCCAAVGNEAVLTYMQTGCPADLEDLLAAFHSNL